jgi:competence protein ComEC
MLANLLAIPICNFVVMPAALATLVAMPLWLEAAPLWVMGLGIEAMMWCAHIVSGLPGAVGRVPSLPAQLQQHHTAMPILAALSPADC